MEHPTVSAGITLPPDRAEVAHARQFMSEQCQALGVAGDARDTAVLLISETVTNAFIHGRSEARILVVGSPAMVRVEVSDDNSRHPSLADDDPEALDGRGLSIIDLLADRWGVDRDRFGKTVWFEVALQKDPRPEAEV